MGQKLKAVMPSLRERKRYIVFDILSDKQFSGTAAGNAITKAVVSFVGELGLARMGLVILTDNYHANKGIVRVGHTGVDAFKASIALMSSIEGHPAVVRSVKVSGNIGVTKTAMQSTS